MTDLVSQLVGALEFYADPLRYSGPNQRSVPGDKHTPDGAPYMVDVTRDGGQIARAALTAAKAGGWVSVDDRLPEQYIEVLVAFDGITVPSTGQYTGNARDVNGWSYPSENFGSTYQGTDPIVTHWQPLPNPPKEQS